MHFLSKLSVAAIAVLAATSDARAHRNGLARRHGGENHGAAAVETPAVESPVAEVPADQYVDTNANVVPGDEYLSASSASEESPVEYYTGMHVSNSTTAATATATAVASTADAVSDTTSAMAMWTGYEEPLVTKVVYSTSVATITDCGETITDCAAGSTVLVTSVIAVSTTVCPASEAEASGYGPTDSPSVAVPIGTGVSEASPVPTGDMEYSTEVKDVTLTYTQGSGSSTTVVTTTVRLTQTLTQTRTAVVTRATSSADGAVVDATAVPTAAEEMSTYDYTSTETQFITLSAVPASYSDQSNVVSEEVVAENVSGEEDTPAQGESGTDSSNVSGTPDGTDSSNVSGTPDGTDSSNVSGTPDDADSSNVGTEGESPVCPAPVTVTVTSATTVTVTANPVAESLSPQQTVSSVYYGNGTESQPCTKGCVASTGFVTLVSTYPASSATPVSTEAPVSTDASPVPTTEENTEEVQASPSVSAEVPEPSDASSVPTTEDEEPVEESYDNPAHGEEGHDMSQMPDAY